MKLTAGVRPTVRRLFDGLLTTLDARYLSVQLCKPANTINKTSFARLITVFLQTLNYPSKLSNSFLIDYVCPVFYRWRKGYSVKTNQRPTSPNAIQRGKQNLRSPKCKCKSVASLCGCFRAHRTMGMPGKCHDTSQIGLADKSSRTEMKVQV